VPTASNQTRELLNGATLSPDQNLLYVAGLHGIWVINTQTLKVQGEYLKQQDFTSVAISSNGQTLYAVDPSTGITLLDPSSGGIRTVLKGAVQAPWGIEWTN
jgi:DNA-binding beta-propeller fold protein YncE